MLHVRLISWIAVVGLLAASASAQTRNPWEWTLEERIAERLDDRKMSERRAAQGERPITGFVIDGTRNPALFMPSELMTRLLMALRDDAYGADLRRHFEPEISAFGWDAAEFWRAFREIGGRWTALAARSEELQKSAHREAPARRRELEAEAAGLDVPMCRARAEALRKAREHFGRAEFDRFLYSALTPGFTISSATLGDDEAARLRYVEGGCP